MVTEYNTSNLALLPNLAFFNKNQGATCHSAYRWWIVKRCRQAVGNPGKMKHYFAFYAVYQTTSKHTKLYVYGTVHHLYS